MLRADRAALAREVKLLLLGAGESGKSTIAKQLKIIHCNGFEPNELLAYKPLIASNCLSAMQAILAYVEENEIVLGAAVLTARDAIVPINANDTDLTPALGAHIKALWADAGVQEAYKHRSEFQLIDSARTFFTDIDRLSAADFRPTERDALTVRTRTTGIIELEFQFMDARYRLIDVGGQRSERKKWIHCFQDVTAILFVAALSGYDLVLFECRHRNRMLEAIELFDDICNTSWFVDTSIILFLNKCDLFREKIESGIELSECFPHYSGPLTYDDTLRFIRSEFLQRNRDAQKSIYPHVTCATDTKNIEVVFGAISDTLLRGRLDSAGLMI